MAAALRRARHGGTLLLLLAACAAPPESAGSSGRGPADVAALPTKGWVELAVVDAKVPADPSAPSGTRGRTQACELEVELDGERVLFEVLEPKGTAPPYSIDATFRFAAAPGIRSAAIYYSSCRTAGRQLDSIEARVRIAVRPGHVTRMRFDGTRLRTYPPADPRLERGTAG